MKRKMVFLVSFSMLLLACSFSAPIAAPTPTNPPTPSLEPSPQPSLTSVPTRPPTAASAAQHTLAPTRTSTSVRPTTTRVPTSTRFPTLVSRMTEVKGAQCPFNIPVKVAAPAVEPGGFDWKAVITPMGDACVSKIKIAPNDERTWYVGGQTALYVTRDEGKTWERPLTGQVSAIELDPSSPNRVLASFQVANTVYESTDLGKTWRLLKKFDQGVMSLHLSKDGMIVVGPHWGASPTPNGVYLSTDRGATWQHSAFGGAQRGLILWDIGEDPQDQTLYIGTEIFDHPQPYKPPLFRSRDRGKTWQEISGTLPWHVLEFAIPADGATVYALTEGAGLYSSTDHGDHWTRLGVGPTISMAIDPQHPERFFGGAQFSPAHNLEGGVFVSTDRGRSFNLVGIKGLTAGEIAFTAGGDMLVAAYSSGIYRAQLP